MSEQNKTNKIPLWLSSKNVKELNQYVEESNCSSRNQFIEEAIKFYGGFIRTAEENQYLPIAIASALNGITGKTEDRLSKLIFKLSVELSMTMHILASTVEIDETTLRKLRAKCVKDIKATVGTINFEEIVKYQKRGL